MAISNLLVHFKTKAQFLTDLNAGNIRNDALVFIKDIKKIWTHGQYYPYENAGILTAGSYLTGGTYDGSSAVTMAVDATTAATANKVVARDASGNINAAQVNATSVVATTGYFSGGAFKSSDKDLKENIQPITQENIDKVNEISNKEFDFKKTKEHSYGVIAQDLNELFPELVGTNPVTGKLYVDYIALHTLQIEALKNEISSLKEIINNQQNLINKLSK